MAAIAESRHRAVRRPADRSTSEHRLTELEIKASYAEDLMDRLNEVIVRQQGQIALLVRELAALRQRDAGAGNEELRSLRDEMPPHY